MPVKIGDPLGGTLLHNMKSADLVRETFDEAFHIVRIRFFEQLGKICGSFFCVHCDLLFQKCLVFNALIRHN